MKIGPTKDRVIHCQIKVCPNLLDLPSDRARSSLSKSQTKWRKSFNRCNFRADLMKREPWWFLRTKNAFLISTSTRLLQKCTFHQCPHWTFLRQTLLEFPIWVPKTTSVCREDKERDRLNFCKRDRTIERDRYRNLWLPISLNRALKPLQPCLIIKAVKQRRESIRRQRGVCMEFRRQSEKTRVMRVTESEVLTNRLTKMEDKLMKESNR